MCTVAVMREKSFTIFLLSLKQNKSECVEQFESRFIRLNKKKQREDKNGIKEDILTAEVPFLLSFPSLIAFAVILSHTHIAIRKEHQTRIAFD